MDSFLLKKLNVTPPAVVTTMNFQSYVSLSACNLLILIRSILTLSQDQLELHSSSYYAAASGQLDNDSDYNPDSKLDTSETESESQPHLQVSARDQVTGHQQRLQRRRMTPRLARQKASELSYEIGALKKIQERLERQRERLLMYCK